MIKVMACMFAMLVACSPAINDMCGLGCTAAGRAFLPAPIRRRPHRSRNAITITAAFALMWSGSCRSRQRSWRWPP